MARSHIPFLESITDFFRVYGLGKPLHTEVMCMRLQDQPDNKLMYMPLYRANFFRVILFTNATLHFVSGAKKHNVAANSLCFTYPGKLESWNRKGKLYGYVIYFTAAFAGIDNTHSGFEKEYPFFRFDSEQQLLLTTRETSELKRTAQALIAEMYSTHADKYEMIKNLLSVYLLSIRRVYNIKVNRQTNEIRQSKSLFNRFRMTLDVYMQQLAAQRNETMPSVSILAKLLTVNPNYLNSVIKSITGRPASAHIQEKIIIEAKAYLAHTNLQVASVSFKLGFENPSYFNRFFKKQAGITPVQFRKSLLK